jgi:hypothetical protein
MRRPSSSPYLFRRSGWYYFRIVIPEELRSLVGQNEIRYSLQTGCYTTARLRAMQFVSYILPLLERLRSGMMEEESPSHC